MVIDLPAAEQIVADALHDYTHRVLREIYPGLEGRSSFRGAGGVAGHIVEALQEAGLLVTDYEWRDGRSGLLLNSRAIERDPVTARRRAGQQLEHRGVTEWRREDET